MGVSVDERASVDEAVRQAGKDGGRAARFLLAVALPYGLAVWLVMSIAARLIS